MVMAKYPHGRCALPLPLALWLGDFTSQSFSFLISKTITVNNSIIVSAHLGSCESQ